MGDARLATAENLVATDVGAVDGLRLFARHRPAREAATASMLLLPGLGLSGRYLVPTLAALPAEVDAYALDPPGFGASSRPERILDVHALAEVVARWIELHGLADLLVFGNSFGSQLAVELALRAPQAVGAVVLGAPTPVATKRSYAVHLVRLFEVGWKAPRDLRRIARHDYASAGLRRLAVTGHYALTDPIDRKLPHVSQPALVLHGADDPLSRASWARRVADLLPDGSFAVVAGTAHAAAFTAPVEVARLITAFAGKLVQRPP